MSEKTVALGAVIQLSHVLTLPYARVMLLIVTKKNKTSNFFLIVHCSAVTILSRNVFMSCMADPW